MVSGFLGLALGASALGLTHGLAPGHGWAIAASYALDKPNKWFYGAASSLILGVGHLISSVAMVLLYFWALSYFGFTQLGWMTTLRGRYSSRSASGSMSMDTSILQVGTMAILLTSITPMTTNTPIHTITTTHMARR